MGAEQIAVAVGAAVGAGGLGGLLAYFTARRRASGQVGTTDADRLWTQYDGLLKGLRADNDAMRGRLVVVDGRMATLESANLECLHRAEALAIRLEAAEEILKVKSEKAAADLGLAEAKTAVAEGKTEIAELKIANGGGAPPKGEVK